MKSETRRLFGRRAIYTDAEEITAGYPPIDIKFADRLAY